MMAGVALILLPGMDGTGVLFESFVAALGGEFDVKVVRYPADQPLDYAGLEEIARAAIPPDGPLILLGESFSGPIAVSLAASLGTRVIGLVLACTFVRNPLPLLSGLRGLVNKLPVQGMPASLFAQAMLSFRANPPLRAAHAAALEGVSAAVLHERMRAVLEVDVSAKLAQLRMPLLYLRATRDWVVPRAAGSWVAQIAPHTQMVEFDAPHFLLQTVPQKTARAVREFIQTLPLDHQAPH